MGLNPHDVDTRIRRVASRDGVRLTALVIGERLTIRIATATGQTPEKRPETAPAQAAPVSPVPKPREHAGDIVWRDAGDGSLYTVYKNQPYRAIPMAAWGLPTERMVEKRTIHGVEYAIFALKDGRIL